MLKEILADPDRRCAIAGISKNDMRGLDAPDRPAGHGLADLQLVELFRIVAHQGDAGRPGHDRTEQHEVRTLRHLRLVDILGQRGRYPR